MVFKVVWTIAAVVLLFVLLRACIAFRRDAEGRYPDFAAACLLGVIADTGLLAWVWLS